jgi:drug/metabolite transporter (DMT)-like permease
LSHAPQPSERNTDLGLVVLTLVWGLNFAVVKGALELIPALAFNALRFPIAALTVYLILRMQGPLTLPDRKDLPKLALLGIGGNGIYQLLFIHGLDRTSAGNSALILATVPVWTLLLSAAAGEARLDRRILLGITTTLLGMGFVVLGGEAQVGFQGTTLPGDLMILGSALLWALYTVGSRGLILRYGSVPVTAWTLWAGTLPLVLLGVPELRVLDWGEIPVLAGWGAVVFAGVLALGLSYVLWYRGVHRLGSARTAVYSNLVPVVAVLSAWPLLGEIPGPLQWVGMGVIGFGIILTRRRAQA